MRINTYENKLREETSDECLSNIYIICVSIITLVKILSHRLI